VFNRYSSNIVIYRLNITRALCDDRSKTVEVKGKRYGSPEQVVSELRSPAMLDHTVLPAAVLLDKSEHTPP